MLKINYTQDTQCILILDARKLWSMSEKEELMIDFVNMNALIATCNSCSSK
jgi:hypothetical protein